MKKSKLFIFVVAGFLGMMGLAICASVIILFINDGEYQNIFDVLKEFIIIMPITYIWAGICGMVFYKEYEKIKVKSALDRQKIMKKGMMGYFIVALVSIIALIIFIGKQNSLAIKLSIGVILALSIIEFGGYLGYKNLQKDIDAINEKLKEQNSNK